MKKRFILTYQVIKKFTSTFSFPDLENGYIKKKKKRVNQKDESISCMKLGMWETASSWMMIKEVQKTKAV